jgi:hypothetical protein
MIEMCLDYLTPLSGDDLNASGTDCVCGVVLLSLKPEFSGYGPWHSMSPSEDKQVSELIEPSGDSPWRDAGRRLWLSLSVEP